MTTVSDFYKNIKSVQLRGELPVIVQDTSEEIETLNKDQLYHGLNTKEKTLKPYSWAGYAEEKHRMNPLPGLGTPDLKLTGSFYEGLQVVVKGYNYEVDSSDSKSDKLEKKYGKQIFGLSDQNKTEYAQGALYTGIKFYIEGQTGLKFK